MYVGIFAHVHNMFYVGDFACVQRVSILWLVGPIFCMVVLLHLPNGYPQYIGRLAVHTVCWFSCFLWDVMLLIIFLNLFKAPIVNFAATKTSWMKLRNPITRPRSEDTDRTPRSFQLLILSCSKCKHLLYAELCTAEKVKKEIVVMLRPFFTCGTCAVAISQSSYLAWLVYSL